LFLLFPFSPNAREKKIYMYSLFCATWSTENSRRKFE